MKAVVRSRYGTANVLEVQDVPDPLPAKGEVLVRVHSAGVNKGDWHLMTGEPFPVRLVFGLTRPKLAVLGSDIAGTVVAVGPGVTRFGPGDEVFGDLASSGFGAFAEQACLPEKCLQPKPSNVSFDQAGSVAISGQTALQGLRDDGGLKAGQDVLINGASGNVGMLAVQIAKALGASVTGVCAARNITMVQSLGADRVIDYRQQDFTTEGIQYDLILDTAAHRPPSEVRRALRPGGRYVMVGGSTPLLFKIMLFGRWLGGSDGCRFTTMMQKSRPEDLKQLRIWMEEGRVAPVVDQVFGLDEIATAMDRLTTGKAAGKLVIHPA